LQSKLALTREFRCRLAGTIPGQKSASERSVRIGPEKRLVLTNPVSCRLLRGNGREGVQSFCRERQTCNRFTQVANDIQGAGALRVRCRRLGTVESQCNVNLANVGAALFS
jgi:hypothetical protein